MRKSLFALISALAWLSAPATHASSDIGCVPSWTLSRTEYSECDNSALLSPGNDTRANLQLLMMDFHPDKIKLNPSTRETASPRFLYEFQEAFQSGTSGTEQSTYSYGEGSRCLSNEPGVALFEQALANTPALAKNERDRLLETRKAIVKLSCTKPDQFSALGTDALKLASSPAAKEFASYLAGTAAFYEGDFVTAKQQFQSLQNAAQPWLKETANYMIARVDLNVAQLDAFDDYGSIEIAKVEPINLKSAEAEFQAFLSAYPNSSLSASAHGLLRRVYWLGNNQEKLMAQYSDQITQTNPSIRNLNDTDLVLEIDAKFLAGADALNLTDPTFLAVRDLRLMRHSPVADDDDTPPKPPITKAELEAQRPLFINNMPLYDYLLAAHAFYVANKPADVLEDIPAPSKTAPPTYLEFSRQTLRGLALDKLNYPNARDLWVKLLASAQKPLQRPVLEIALALHDEKNATIEKTFEPDSPVQDAHVRALLLAHIANAKLLRQQASNPNAAIPERHIALATLLYKDITRGAYADFIRDFVIPPPPQIPDPDSQQIYLNAPSIADFTWEGSTADFTCPSVLESAKKLALNSKNPTALLCVADFIRDKGFDYSDLDHPPLPGNIGGSPSQFPGKNFSRQHIYQIVMTDRKATKEDKAYALYRAVNCYAPSNNNTCGGEDVDVSQRKAWYKRLKSEFAASPWAKALHTYW